VLRNEGHEVLDVPKGKGCADRNYDGIDLVLDVDCGRDEKGVLHWMAQEARLPVPSAVMFIDSHGYPSLHHRVGKNYDHVFFAVWDKRDLFAKHPSAHWCPNFTDSNWFDAGGYIEEKVFDFGFFGSKGGLERADRLVNIANNNGWTHDVRQICPGHKHRWPFTGTAMAKCKNLFNKAQKHDGPNLRVMESMAMGRPLICDRDERSGMDKLFTPYEHYVPYEYFKYEGLEDAMEWVMIETKASALMAERAYREVMDHHLVENRVEQILEVAT
jgi:hypothetical protein